MVMDAKDLSAREALDIDAMLQDEFASLDLGAGKYIAAQSLIGTKVLNAVDARPSTSRGSITRACLVLYSSPGCVCRRYAPSGRNVGFSSEEVYSQLASHCSAAFTGVPAGERSARLSTET